MAKQFGRNKRMEYMVKAQVLGGGRGMGHFKENNFHGGVHKCRNPEEVKEVAEKMLFGKFSSHKPVVGENQEDNVDIENMNSPSIATPDPQKRFQQTFFQPDAHQINLSLQKEIFIKEIESEISDFKKLLLKDNSKIINECESTKDFWIQHGKQLPKISELARIVLNINSSSAFIERFFKYLWIYPR